MRSTTPETGRPSLHFRQAADYATVVAVARKVSESVLQEDRKLLMWYDQTVTRSGGA